MQRIRPARQAVCLLKQSGIAADVISNNAVLSASGGAGRLRPCRIRQCQRVFHPGSVQVETSTVRSVPDDGIAAGARSRHLQCRCQRLCQGQTVGGVTVASATAS